MSCSLITIQGTIINAETDPNNNKNVIASFQPTIKDSPLLNVKAYGDLGYRLRGLVDFDAVLTGKILHLPDQKAIFDIDLSECYLSGEYGEPKAIAMIVGRFAADKEWHGHHQTKNGKDSFKFQVSYACGKVDGKTQYANWECVSYAKNAENIGKHFITGKTIQVVSELSWYASNGKLFLNTPVTKWDFVGGKGE